VRPTQVTVGASGAWAIAIVAGLTAAGVSALAWLAPIAAAASVALVLRPVRTLAWALPVAVVASLDPVVDWPRVGLALVAVAAAITAVGLLDGWTDAGPGRSAAAALDPADRVAWWAARRPALGWLGGGLVAVVVGWTGLAAVSWSAPGWLVAMVPAIAVIAVAAATWSQWRPVER